MAAWNVAEVKELEKEWLKKSLSKVGLKPAEIEVYALLALSEPKTVKQISQSLNITKERVYPKVNSLKKMGCIKAIAGQGKRFCAEPIDQILKSYADEKNKEALNIKEKKQTILKDWTFDNRKTF